MQNEKSLTIRRIIIYLILTFAPAYFFEIVTVDKDAESYITSAFGGNTLMLYPALANVLTRLITKQGFPNNLLKFNLKGHMKYYWIGILFPVINGLLAGTIFSAIYIDHFDLAANIENLDGIISIIANIIMIILTVVFELFMGFGEEFGWRAYLTPELEKLLPSPVAIAITGIIWGLWHAPLITLGYDWGTGYPFFPYLGIIAMCISCIFLSMILTYITKKTNSVWPAAICHTIIDAGMMFMSVLMVGYQNEDIFTEHTFTYALLGMLICPLIISIPMMISMFRKQESAV